MTLLVDVKELKKKSKRRFAFHIALIAMLIAATISITILSLLFSSLDYTWNVIINIVLTATVTSFVIFYFLNIFPIVKHYYTYFKNMSSANLDHRRRMVFLKENGEKLIDNVSYRVVQFLYKEGENEYNDNLYLLDNDASFIEGKAYKLDTYHNVIVGYQEI